MKLLSLILCFTCFCALSQQVRVNDYTIDESGTVNVDFTIAQSHSSREIYDVLFYSSVDNFSDPIAFRLENVKAGENKRATFSGSEQFGGYNGPLQLKLVAQATIFPIKISPIDKGLKIGKTNTISWMDYHGSGPYDVSLYQGTQLKSKLASGISTTSYTGEIAKSLVKGNYSILVTPSDDRFLSEQYPVTLKKAINPLIFVGAAALVGGGAFVATSGGGGDPPVITDTNLPDPPGPPSGN